MKLKGKHALITGAAAGIGAAICKRFAEEGARITIADINATKAEIVQADILANGGEAHIQVCDISSHDQCRELVRKAEECFGPIDFLVNCAGGAIVGGEFQPFYECSDAFISKLIGINLMGTIYMCRETVPGMRERERGKIINFSSIRALTGDGNCVLYGTSKGAIISFTESLAIEMAPYHVTVNSIAPGAINSRPGPGSAENHLGRPGTCEEVASLALFLASDEADFITGETIVIDGGRTLAALGDHRRTK